MKREYLTKILLGVLVILALFLRVNKLDTLPYGFHIDEVKAGVNAWSILQTGKDDKGNFMPMYYDSFGDFRPTGLFYFLIPSLALLGKSVLAVRLPVAIIGALSVIPLFLLVNEVNKKGVVLGLLAGLLITINPWHINLSRATSEGIISLFFCLWGLYFLVKGESKKGWWLTVAAVLTMGASYLFYHNIRVLSPVFALIFAYFYKSKKMFLGAVTLLVLTGLVMSTSEARGRLSQVTIKSDFRVAYETQKLPNEDGANNVLEARIFHNKIAAYLKVFAQEYSQYFGTDFLVGSASKPERYDIPYIGLLTYVEFGLVVLGLMVLLKNKRGGVWGVLLLVSPVVAAVTIEDTPNMHRSMFMIPFLMIIGAYGLGYLWESDKKKILFMLGICGLLANFSWFDHAYKYHQKYGLASVYRDAGNVELVKVIEDKCKSYDKIVVAGFPDILEPWVRFLGDGSIEENKIQYVKARCPSIEYNKKVAEGNVLMIDAEGCEPERNLEAKMVGTVKRPDTSPVYCLMEPIIRK